MNQDESNIITSTQSQLLSDKNVLKSFISSWTLKNKIRKSNPSISFFNSNSHFIYEPRYFHFWFDKFSNKNLFKPNEPDILFLKQSIENLNTEQAHKNKKDKEIEVLDIFYEVLNNTKKIEPIFDSKTLRIKNLIENCNKSMNISCRRLQSKYIEKYKEYISHNTIYKILKNILGYRFKKSTIKTEKLLSNEAIKQTYFYLKIFLRGLKLGMDFIYIDESSIYTVNNNYRTWKFPDEDIYFPIKDSLKRNLLLAVNKDKNIFFELTEKTTTSLEFKNFFAQMLSKLSEEKINNTIFILDNHPSHSTPELFELYHEKKIKILFGVPYLSKFNMIELVFRGIKNILYMQLFESITEIEKKVKEILCDNNFCLSYKFYFKETLNNYYKFIILNNNINLNI